MARTTVRSRSGRRRPRSGGHSPIDEILGVGLLAAGLLLFISLASYDASDGDLFIHLVDTPPANLGGHVGATLAALAVLLVGAGAFLLPLALIGLGVSRLRSRPLTAPLSKAAGFGALFFFACVLAEYGFGTLPLGGEPTAAGGLLGIWGGDRLREAFGAVGGPLVATTACVVAIVFLTRISIAALAHRACARIAAAARRIRTLWVHTREARRKARQRARVIRKYAERHGRTAQAERRARRRTPGGPLVTIKVPLKATRLGAPLPEEPAETAPAAAAEPATPPIEMPAEPAPPLPFEQPAGPDGSYALPGAELLREDTADRAIDQRELMDKAKAITSKAAEFRVTGEVVAIHPGPVVTTFEFRPGTGVKYSRITNLEDDLSLALRAESIRIARLPGKATVGIEVPNNERATIALREIVESAEFRRSKSKLTLVLGKQIHGENVVTDLARMPHLLIAGTTGSGKSVALNCMLLSLLYRATPDEVKVVLIDPKRLEFGLYEDIPHLLTPVVVEPKLAANALSWAVREMERRYRLLADYGVRDIARFNLILQRGGEELTHARDDAEVKPLPYIVVIIDELADLMMTASAVVEETIIRLSQMARAVGIHLILATQRPSVDVLTGVIKNNLPARISFRVASKVDSRVILDTQGAEALLGRGDMLYLAPGTSRLTRIHGAFVTEQEVKAVVNFWRTQARPRYSEEVTQPPPDRPEVNAGKETKRDEYFEEAVRLVLAAGEASVSNIQRKLGLGYARAGRIIDMMEQEGIVGPPRGSKPRKVLIDAWGH